MTAVSVAIHDDTGGEQVLEFILNPFFLGMEFSVTDFELHQCGARPVSGGYKNLVVDHQRGGTVAFVLVLKSKPLQ